MAFKAIKASFPLFLHWAIIAKTPRQRNYHVLKTSKGVGQYSLRAVTDSLPQSCTAF